MHSLPHSAGIARVLWTDYNYVLLYECFAPLDADGNCPPHAVTIVVFGRSDTLPQRAIGRLIPVAATACVGVNDFELVPHTGRSRSRSFKPELGQGQNNQN